MLWFSKKKRISGNWFEERLPKPEKSVEVVKQKCQTRLIFYFFTKKNVEFSQSTQAPSKKFERNLQIPVLESIERVKNLPLYVPKKAKKNSGFTDGRFSLQFGAFNSKIYLSTKCEINCVDLSNSALIKDWPICCWNWAESHSLLGRLRFNFVLIF